MSDPIPPPAAGRPAETVELVSVAISDGDLEAALAQYEPEAVLQPWAGETPESAGGLGSADEPADDTADALAAAGAGASASVGIEAGAGAGAGAGVGVGVGVGEILRGLMQLRIPLSVQVRAVLPAGDLALVLGERQLAAAGPDQRPIRLHGFGATVVRRQPDGTWRIVADAWRLDGPGAADLTG